LVIKSGEIAKPYMLRYALKRLAKCDTSKSKLFGIGEAISKERNKMIYLLNL